MPVPFVLTSTLLTAVSVIPGLPRPRTYDPMPHGMASAKHVGRKLDAYAAAFSMMKSQARSYFESALSLSSGDVLQRLVVAHGDSLCFTLEQTLRGWPIPAEGFWMKKLGRPMYVPLQRQRGVVSGNDCNGVLYPLPLRMFISVAGTNRQRLWCLAADGMPSAYFLSCPNGDRRFIHAAHLGQLILSSCPEALHEILGLA